MTVAILVLTDDRPARAEEFYEQAKAMREALGAPADAMHLCAKVEDLISIPYSCCEPAIEHLALFCHGTPTGLMRPGRWGIDTRPAKWRRPAFISPEEFAAVWGPRLAEGALVSLAACLCSRDPKWYRVQRWGRDISPWSAHSYRDGGLKSLAAVLCRAFAAAELPGIVVRGHCAAGHCTRQALLREHCAGDEDGIGRALFGKVLRGQEPTRELMQRWQAKVKGRLAREYLLGLREDAELLSEMKEAMGL